MRLLLILVLASPLSGCFRSPKVEVSPEAFFCDLGNQRKFTQEQVDWRSANDATNFRKDLSENLSWDEEDCDTFSERVTGAQ